MFIRQLHKPLLNDLLNSNKVIVLYGPRQAGKTTLSKAVVDETGLKSLMINADQLKYIDVLSSRDLAKLKSLVSGYELLFIDEGQRIPDIGINLKILHDEIPELKLLVTGSSSFLLSDKVSEALTGRKKVYTLLPISTSEMAEQFNPFELNDQLHNRLVFGSYPEILTLNNNADKAELLHEITTSYLYKDIIELESIRFPMKIRDLLKLLAHQIGSQVSLNELCTTIGLNRETVERYLFLLEQSFIIFRLPAFSRNARNEISKSQKFYFYDTGIRNCLIDNLKSIDNRSDTGSLWENFVIAERIKRQHNLRKTSKFYFWRTYNGTEIDLIEEIDGTPYPYEIKWNKPRTSAPKAWAEAYGDTFKCVTLDNYLEFV